LGTGLGFGVLGLLAFLFGLAGLFRPSIFYAVTIVLSVISVPLLVRLFRWGRRCRPANLLPWPVGLYLGALALLTLLVALLPPTDWDGLFYHLTGPKLYFQAGRIVDGVDIPHLSFPALMEMLFTWAMLLRGDIAAKLLHACFGLLLVGLVYLIARRCCGRKSAWLAVLVLASMPMINTLAGWAYNDLALAFYQLASLYAIINYLLIKNDLTKRSTYVSTQSPIHHLQFISHNSSLSWLLLSAIFAGLAMGLKYTSFVTPLVVAALIGWDVIRSKSNPTRLAALKNLAIFALTAGLVAAPWYVKNWFFSGNPVYPFLYHLFGGLFWDIFRADWYAAAGTGVGLKPTTWLVLPWLLTLGLRDANYWDGRTGPLLLLFLPLVLLYGLARPFRRAPDRPRALDPLLIFALAQFGIWTLGVLWSRALWQSRLLLPCFAALAPVVGWIWADLPRFDLPHFSLSRFVNLAIGLTLALTLIDLGLLTLRIDPLPYLAGFETRDEYLTRRLGAHYAAMQEINDTLPAEATIIFLWEPRSYYCRSDCRPDSILDTFPHLVHRYGSAEAIAQYWREAGITHVLIHRSGLTFVLNEMPETVDRAILADLETNFLDLEFGIAGSYQVYALR
jgi:4-amino-4-deoxy-L-arabinose transferase-like glycosyltransferase